MILTTTQIIGLFFVAGMCVLALVTVGLYVGFTKKDTPKTISLQTTSLTTPPQTTSPQTTPSQTTSPQTTSPQTTPPQTTSPRTTSPPQTTSPLQTTSPAPLCPRYCETHEGGTGRCTKYKSTSGWCGDDADWGQGYVLNNKYTLFDCTMCV